MPFLVLHNDIGNVVGQPRCTTINGENQLLVTNEPVEFEKSPIEVRDCKKITDHFREFMEYTSNMQRN